MRMKTHNEINKSMRYGSIQFLYGPIHRHSTNPLIYIYLYICSIFSKRRLVHIFLLLHYSLPPLLPSSCLPPVWELVLLYIFRIAAGRDWIKSDRKLLFASHSLGISFIHCMTHSKLFVRNTIYISNVSVSAQHAFFLCTIFFLPSLLSCTSTCY